MGLMRKQRFVRCSSHVETLERRQMLSVVNVTPSNFLAAIKSSSSGDTISFAPGEYDINDGSVVYLPGNHTYVGNGAVFKGLGYSIVDLSYTSNVDFSGFVLDGAFAKVDESDHLNFHNNTITNGQDGLVFSGTHDSHLDGNTFTNLTGNGIYGYPGDNLTANNNTFDSVWEPIHFAAATCNNTQVSGNVITNAIRIAIELQEQGNGLQVDNNWVGQWAPAAKGNGHMGLSIATGYCGNIQISGNTILQTGPGSDIGGCAIESFGHDITISNNYAYGWWSLILNGSEPGGISSVNNTIVGGNVSAYDNVGGAYNIGPVTSSGDKLFALTDPNAPAAPAPRSTPASSPAPTPAPTPAPAATPAITQNLGNSILGGTQSAAPSSYNLTALGTADWAHWGRAGAYGNFDHKAAGASQISNVTVVGSGAVFGGYSDPSRNATWTDGTPAGSDNNEHGYIWSNGALNTGYSFTVPADTTARTLTVYAGGINTTSSLTAHLSDGSSADVVMTAGAAGLYTNQYTITYHAASAGQTLTITLLKTGNLAGQTGGSADLIAAVLSGPIPTAAPATSSSPPSSSGATSIPASAAGTFIDAGGPATGSYSADANYSGGSTFSASNAIDTSADTTGAPASVYQSERYGNFTYTVPGLVAGNTYKVNLHFAEIYATGAGQRLFNVSINGQQVLNNFDIFATAGGANKALVQSFNATADASGRVTIVFTGVKENAKVSAIDVIAAGAAATANSSSTVPVTSASAGTFIDAGGPAAGSYSADANYSGGSTFSTSNAIDTSADTTGAPASIYQSERYGNFTYTVPGLVAGNTYKVNLHFAEIYATGAGQRLFNVSINGQQVLNNFDIFATAGGANKALVQSFNATADASGRITIVFTSVTENAKVSAIDVVPA